ncbi:hypothetical protein GCM10009682_00960 [Luedemannella flava]|uniref:Uncharacterized protein n=1 Tax=Luedemannella flava TaxID=349316 RepID=A0ABP4XGX5_9ACTN
MVVVAVSSMGPPRCLPHAAEPIFLAKVTPQRRCQLCHARTETHPAKPPPSPLSLVRPDLTALELPVE